MHAIVDIDDTNSNHRYTSKGRDCEENSALVGLDLDQALTYL